MKYLVILMMVFMANIFAKDIFGRVDKIKGEVYLNDKKITTPLEVYVGDEISTKDKSKVKIISTNDSVITIGKDSKLILTDEKKVKQIYGKAFFRIISSQMIKNKNYKFQIILKSSTIGIRGTNFIVSVDDTKENVILRKGNLHFDALEDKQFAIYKKSQDKAFDDYLKKQKDEFKSYMDSMNKEFEQYKKQEEYEFKEYKQEFSLEEKTMVVLDDDKVYKSKLSKKDIEKEFEEFDSFNLD